VGAEEEKTTNSGPSLAGREVESITVCMKDHVGGLIIKNSIRMGGTLIENVGGSLHCGFSAIGLCCGECVDGNEHGINECMSIIQQHANDLLECFIPLGGNAGDSSGDSAYWMAEL